MLTCINPSDLAAQARQVYANLGRALAAAGAEPRHVARITIFEELLPLVA